MPINDEMKKRIVANVQQITPEKMVAELKRHAQEVKEQVKKLEEAKVVDQQTMQIEASI